MDWASIEQVLSHLDLEKDGEDRFVGHVSGDGDRVFGGMLLAQGYVAAAKTVSRDRPLHSLHAYFVSAARIGTPLHFSVERCRDGRSFATRRVLVEQRGDVVFDLTASFAVPEHGISHQSPMPDVPGPDGLAIWDELGARVDGRSPQRLATAIEVRLCDVYDVDQLAKPYAPRQRAWLRARGTIPDDPLIHTAVLVYATDRTGLVAAMRPHGLPWGRFSVTTLDHALWIHGTPRLDDWVFFTTESPVAHAARGVVFGGLFRADGTRLASVAQEGLFRRLRS